MVRQRERDSDGPRWGRILLVYILLFGGLAAIVWVMTRFELVGLTLAAAIVLGLVWFNIRRVRTRRLVDSLPAAIRSEVLALIDRAGKEDGTPVLLLRVIDGAVRDEYSRIGGEPQLPPGMPRPAVAKEGSVFLAQVRLQSPPLPAVWSKRVAFLFCDATGQLVACCGADAGPTSAAPVTRALVANERGIETISLPPGDTVDNESDEVGPSSPYAPESLCRRIPALRRVLAKYSDKPERMLPHILVPGIGTHEIDTFLVSLMGGEPELIQAEHGASCPRCSQPMRFLFQFGDVLGLAGDAPVVYVYGCDGHPDELQVYLDMH